MIPRSGAGRIRPLRFLLLAGLCLVTACSTLPRGEERLAAVDRAVEEQDFARAQTLLDDLDTADPEFETLVLRRRALRPLISQFEDRTLNRVADLTSADRWPAARELLDEARGKLPDSERLREAEADFYDRREARLAEIDRQLDLLKARHLAERQRLVETAAEIRPDGIKQRWRAYRHRRESRALAGELLSCAEEGLDASDHTLAEACLRLADSLGPGEERARQLAELRESLESERARAVARDEARRESQESARRAQRESQLASLKERYQSLVAASWWSAARDLLSELQRLAPEDEEVVQWEEQLQTRIDQHVNDEIQRGQSLYSRGQLRDALAVWRGAERLAPDNETLNEHIARVERFLDKLERLDRDS